jgi:hypothetical protein
MNIEDKQVAKKNSRQKNANEGGGKMYRASNRKPDEQEIRPSGIVKALPILGLAAPSRFKNIVWDSGNIIPAQL